MNYLYILFETLFVFLILILLYKIGKKDGLFIYIGFMGTLLGIVIFKLVDIVSFPINYGLPILMGIFTASNIIIHKFGSDEIKRIICSFIIPYIIIIFVISLGSLIPSSEYNLITNTSYDDLFGYNFENIRCFIGGLISVSFMLWFNGEVYYYIRKNKNNLFFSNLGSILIIQFIESILFVIIAYSGLYDGILIFGMIVIRYLLKVLIGVVGLVPVYLLTKRKGE